MTCSDELLSSKLQMQTCHREREREREKERKKEREKERKREREKKERKREREKERKRERNAVKRPVLASAGISFILENVKQAAKVLSDQSLGDGRFQLSVVAPNELVEYAS